MSTHSFRLHSVGPSGRRHRLQASSVSDRLLASCVSFCLRPTTQQHVLWSAVSADRRPGNTSYGLPCQPTDDPATRPMICRVSRPTTRQHVLWSAVSADRRPGNTSYDLPCQPTDDPATRPVVCRVSRPTTRQHVLWSAVSADRRPGNTSYGLPCQPTDDPAARPMVCRVGRPTTRQHVLWSAVPADRRPGSTSYGLPCQPTDDPATRPVVCRASRSPDLRPPRRCTGGQGQPAAATGRDGLAHFSVCVGGWERADGAAGQPSHTPPQAASGHACVGLRHSA